VGFLNIHPIDISNIRFLMFIRIIRISAFEIQFNLSMRFIASTWSQSITVISFFRQ